MSRKRVVDDTIRRFAEAVKFGESVESAARIAGLCLTEPGGSLHYVYLLIDPRDESMFYVGKGKGRRPWAHVKESRSGKWGNRKKCKRIADIESAGLEVIARSVKTFASEQAAYDAEFFLIRSLHPVLTNLGMTPGVERERVISPEERQKFVDDLAWRSINTLLLLPDRGDYVIRRLGESLTRVDFERKTEGQLYDMATTIGRQYDLLRLGVTAIFDSCVPRSRYAALMTPGSQS